MCTEKACKTQVCLFPLSWLSRFGVLEVLHSRKVNTIYEQKSPLWKASVSRRNDVSKIKERRCEVRLKELVLERKEVSKDGR